MIQLVDTAGDLGHTQLGDDDDILSDYRRWAWSADIRAAGLLDAPAPDLRAVECRRRHRRGGKRKRHDDTSGDDTAVPDKRPRGANEQQERPGQSMTLEAEPSPINSRTV